MSGLLRTLFTYVYLFLFVSLTFYPCMYLYRFPYLVVLVRALSCYV